MSYVLEKKKRLFNSVIWKKMHEYYANNAHKAWEDGQTPEFVSTNAFIGDYYAKIVHRFLTSTHTNTTHYLLDIGSGSGRFAYHFLKAYERYDCSNKHPLVYIACDYSQKNLDALLGYEYFQPWIEKGTFDVAFFDATKPIDAFELQHQKKTIQQKDIDSPLLVITNYLLASLPIDQVAVDEHDVYVGESTFSMPSREEKDCRKAKINIDYSRKLSPDDQLLFDHFDRCLFPNNTDFPFLAKIPTAAFQLIEELRSFSNNKLVMLCSDVAHYEAKKTGPPPLIHFTHKKGNSWFPLNLGPFNQWIKKTKGDVFYFEKNPHFFTSLISYGISSDKIKPITEIKQESKSWLTPAMISELLYIDEYGVAGLLTALDELMLDPLILIRKQYSIEIFLDENPYFSQELLRILDKHHEHVFIGKSHKNDTLKVLGDLFFRFERYDECIHYLEKAKLKMSDTSCCHRLYLAYCFTGQDKKRKRFRKKYILSMLYRPLGKLKFYWDCRSVLLTSPKFYFCLLIGTALLAHYL